MHELSGNRGGGVMCTLIILNNLGQDWPILLAANRDERRDRPWKPPAAHWPDRPDIVGGLDIDAGGSWLGLNRTGVVAAVLNRAGTLGPQSGKRSRGELVLDALDYPDAVDAADAMRQIDPKAYRPFTLAIADNRDAFLIVHRDPSGKTPIAVEIVPEGLTMVTSIGVNDAGSARTRLYRPRFLNAPTPDPDKGDWAAWENLLASRDSEPGSGPEGSLFIDDRSGFGTVSSSLIALPSMDRTDRKPIWRFAYGAPESWKWEDIILPA
jgi:hypothetical protein